MRSAPLLAAAAAAMVVLSASTALADPLGKTTVEETIKGGKRPAFSFLSSGPGEPFKVRNLGAVRPVAGREKRRRSLTYFAQLSDFQLADEEAPARVEFTDNFSSFFSAAWRPQEALMPHMIDAQIRQVNALSQSRLSDARLGFALLTGDNADSQLLNETDWVNTLLEGGTLNPNSGSADESDYANCPPGTPGTDEAARYTGIQDYSDYVENGEFYDPDRPAGMYAGWPAFPGLMDRAQVPFQAAGLDVPAYVSFGNHDALVQGNQAANAAFEGVSTGCVKPMQANPFESLDLLPQIVQSDPSKTILVPPDPARSYVDKAQYIERFKGSPNAAGFAHVDPAEKAASAGSAGYYSFSPSRGLRFIGLDTVAEGGVVGCSSDGNLDGPQFTWLEGQLEAASDADQLVVLFGHHSIQSLTCPVPDESAPPCTGADAHGHDANPGCDADPRNSGPIKLGADLTALLNSSPHAIAFVAGHSHVNNVQPFETFWNIRTSAEADWPHQQRLIEIFDNRDGTLSIFGTLIDSAAPVAAPPAGADASGFSVDQLASLGRALGYNDPHNGGGTGEGVAEDRNVELLVRDPRRAPGAAGAPAGSPKRVLKVRVKPRSLKAGQRRRVAFRVTAGGRPVRQALVRVGKRRARTNARGIARMRLAPRRAARLRVKVTARGLESRTVRVRVRR